MDLSGIISISGKSGLFKVIGQGKGTIIVESIETGKRIPAYATHKISALEDISIYTVDEDVPLGEVMDKIYEKQDGGKGPDHNANVKELRSFLEEILPDYDEERVYNSDIKKLFQWYNMLERNGVLKESKDKEAEEKSSSAKADGDNKKPSSAKATEDKSKSTKTKTKSSTQSKSESASKSKKAEQ